MAVHGLAAIRAHIDRHLPHAKAKRCCEARCELKLDGLRCRILLKGELARQDRKMCDCIVFAGTDRLAVALAELKSKTARASDVVEKLTNGSLAALEVIGAAEGALPGLTFCFIVLAKAWHRSELVTLTRHRIAVRGTRYRILPKKCGVSLAEVLDSAACAG